MPTTNSSLSVFNYDAAKVRVIQIEGKPWFVASDVCRCLGLGLNSHGQPNVMDACSRLHDDEVTLDGIQTAPERTVRFKLISESGLYKLIMRSDKAEARKFQDWVTREVLTTIRKDGAYVMGEEKVRTGEMTEEQGFSPLASSSRPGRGHHQLIRLPAVGRR